MHSNRVRQIKEWKKCKKKTQRTSASYVSIYMYIATGIGCKRLYCVGHRRHGAILYGVVEYINPAI